MVLKGVSATNRRPRYSGSVIWYAGPTPQGSRMKAVPLSIPPSMKTFSGPTRTQWSPTPDGPFGSPPGSSAASRRIASTISARSPKGGSRMRVALTRTVNSPRSRSPR